MDRGAWWATTHRVTKSQTQLKQFNMHTCTHVNMYVYTNICTRKEKFTVHEQIEMKKRERRTDKIITTLNVSSDSEGLLTPAIWGPEGITSVCF